ncbi:hypothetical protein F5Y19DRAFT_480880 [Xylariaceae sp. FL1651]|nr:hypothetical protein F5Y19DRAFT_480880 [Xylariaceae sp. FL1651]
MAVQPLQGNGLTTEQVAVGLLLPHFAGHPCNSFPIDIDRAVRELCSPDRTWIWIPFPELPPPDQLEACLREQGADLTIRGNSFAPVPTLPLKPTAAASADPSAAKEPPGAKKRRVTLAIIPSETSVTARDQNPQIENAPSLQENGLIAQPATVYLGPGAVAKIDFTYTAATEESGPWRSVISVSELRDIMRTLEPTVIDQQTAQWRLGILNST